MEVINQVCHTAEGSVRHTYCPSCEERCSYTITWAMYMGLHSEPIILHLPDHLCVSHLLPFNYTCLLHSHKEVWFGKYVHCTHKDFRWKLLIKQTFTLLYITAGRYPCEHVNSIVRNWLGRKPNHRAIRWNAIDVVWLHNGYILCWEQPLHSCFIFHFKATLP